MLRKRVVVSRKEWIDLFFVWVPSYRTYIYYFMLTNSSIFFVKRNSCGYVTRGLARQITYNS